MKDEASGIAIEGFVGLKPITYSFLVDDNGEHKKTKGRNWNVAGTIIHNEYKDILLNNKCIRHSMHRIQSKDYKTATFEINKISLSYFNEKIYI